MSSPYVSPVPAGAKYLRSDQGIDFLSPTPILAPGAGVVSDITHGWVGGTGTGVYITLDKPVTVNGNKYEQFYSAESTPLVTKGQRVIAGQPVAAAGSVEIGFWPSPLSGPLGAGTSVNPQALDFGTFVASLGATVPASGQAKPSGGGVLGTVEKVGGTVANVVTLGAAGAAGAPHFVSAGDINAAARHVPGVAQVEGAAGGVADAASGAYDATVSVGKFLGKLTDPSLWLRVLQILAGAFLAGAGLVLLARQIGLRFPSPSPALAAAV